MTGFKSKRAAALDEDGMYLVHQTDHSEDILHMVAQPAQEPVAWQFMNGSTFRKRRPEDFSDLAPDGFPYWKPLYTTLPVAKRPWVDLTDEEISALSKGHMTRNGFARNVIAKFKEKNA